MGGACLAHAILSCVYGHLRHALLLTPGVGCLTEGVAGSRGRYTEKYALPAGDPGWGGVEGGIFNSWLS
jgi:hypothetical protein